MPWRQGWARVVLGSTGRNSGNPQHDKMIVSDRNFCVWLDQSEEMCYWDRNVLPLCSFGLSNVTAMGHLETDKIICSTVCSVTFSPKELLWNWITWFSAGTVVSGSTVVLLCHKCVAQSQPIRVPCFFQPPIRRSHLLPLLVCHLWAVPATLWLYSLESSPQRPLARGPGCYAPLASSKSPPQMSVSREAAPVFQGNRMNLLSRLFLQSSDSVGVNLPHWGCRSCLQIWFMCLGAGHCIRPIHFHKTQCGTSARIWQYIGGYCSSFESPNARIHY